MGSCDFKSSLHCKKLSTAATMEIEKMPCLLVLLFVLSSFSPISSLALPNATSQNIGDSITADKWITIASTIVSSGGNFELGFFTPGNTSKFYIGIWYKKIRPQTVIWVANREIPVTPYELNFTELKLVDGNLVLLNRIQNSIWSTGINATMSNNSKVVAVLHDNGNLILSDGYSNSKPPLWTSFDHPSHTFMPGSKFGYNKRTKQKQVLTSWKNSNDPSPGPFTHEVDISNGQSANMWNNSMIYWSSGPWTGNNFTAVPYQPNPMFNFTYVNNDDEIYFMYTLFSPAIITRFIMDISGQTKQVQWMDSAPDWKVFYTAPKQVCDVFAYCGPFGICSLSSCDCLPGFEPKSEQDWNLNSFSGGCVRKTSLKCDNSSVAESEADMFWMHPHMRLPKNDQ